MHHDSTTEPSGTLSRANLAGARGAALHLLALRPRTVAEMKQRLSKRFGADLSEQTVATLEAEGLLNDLAYAQQWRESRERRNPRSQRMIATELKQKGVSDENIQDALQDFDSRSAAHRAALRYATRQAGKDRATFDRRVGAFLERRGFQASVIRDTVRQLREELGINESDALVLDED